MNIKKPLILLPAALTLLLGACGQSPRSSSQVIATDPGAVSLTRTTTGNIFTASHLTAQSVAAASTLTVGQTKQLNVNVNGQPATPGQLKWTTTNGAVVTVTQSGLVTAVGAGSATVRATIVASPTAYIDFPFTVQPGNSAPTNTGTGSTTFAQRVLALTNTARAQARTCGTVAYPAAPALTYNAQLEQAAQAHAADMATRNYFSHTSQDGRTFDQRISATGYSWSTLAENIAAGQTTPEDVVAGWLNSPGHCQNIMNASLKELGVGYALNTGSTYQTYWVQDFGSH